jgi:uncharacterized membrane protein YdjX (TVP38/TMEM64 family)
VEKSQTLKLVNYVLKMYPIKALLLLRLSPIAPLFVLSYLFGGFESIFIHKIKFQLEI